MLFMLLNPLLLAISKDYLDGQSIQQATPTSASGSHHDNTVTLSAYVLAFVIIGSCLFGACFSWVCLQIFRADRTK